MIAIKAQNITKTYGTGEIAQTVLNSVSLEIKAGEFIGLYGRSGCGKSTLLNILGCLDSFELGNLEVLGNKVSSEESRDRLLLRRNSIGFIFQNFNLNPVLNTFENVEFPLNLLGWDQSKKRTSIHEALSAVGLEGLEKRFPSQLSGGQRQRVAIARAIAKKPAIIIADEPTANLDEENSELIAKLLIALQKSSQSTVICSSHDKIFLDNSTRLITLVNGKEHINAHS